MKQQETLLITGASGFLGSNLVRECLTNNYRVLAYKRQNTNLWRLRDIAEKVVWFDVDELDKPFSQFKINHVIHCATCYGRNDEKSSEIVVANMLLPLQLFELADAYKVTTFFNADTVLDANTNTYALSKSQFNSWLKQASTPLRIVNLKLQHFYGPGASRDNFITNIICQFLAKVPEINLTLGEQQRDFIYITDVVAAFICLLSHVDQLASGYNNFEVGSGTMLAVRELIEFLAKLTCAKTKLNFGALAYRKNELMQTKADISKLTALGWRPKYSLQQGLALTLAANNKGETI